MTPIYADTRPFRFERYCEGVLPDMPEDSSQRRTCQDLTELIVRESPELEAELGAPLEWIPIQGSSVDQPRLLIGPRCLNPSLRSWAESTNKDIPEEPYVAIDNGRSTVVVDAPTLELIPDAFQHLRSAIWTNAELFTARLPRSATAMLDRIDNEVRRTFPNLLNRVPDWATHVETARATLFDLDDLAAVQTLMAHLDDAHSWAKHPNVNARLPYQTITKYDATRFWAVPRWSEAWIRGIRPGDVLMEPFADQWLGRVGAPVHAKPWMLGYRMLAGSAGDTVELKAQDANGRTVRWTEPIPTVPWPSPIEWDNIDYSTGYLRIHTWLNTDAWQDAFGTALDELSQHERLIVDLRGNVGGALIAAQNTRDRFLSSPATMGSVCFSTITGEMAPPAPLIAEPPATGPIWTKPVRFLTDPLCYSATEDFLLGLQGLPHVELVGQTTGGGSGRPRTIALSSSINLTISTALTYTRDGRRIEGNGLVPDIAVSLDPVAPEATLFQAASNW